MKWKRLHRSTIRTLPRLADERESGVTGYIIFRQSPKLRTGCRVRIDLTERVNPHPAGVHRDRPRSSTN